MSEPTREERKTWYPRMPACNAQRTNLPLSIGEALIVKQPEIHKTDHDDISKEQWRLGLGFKVVKHGTIIRGFNHSWNRDPNTLLIQADPWLPGFDIGSPLWSPYNATILRE